VKVTDVELMTQPDHPRVKASAKAIANALLSQKWVYARTQPQSPHEYCLRENWLDETSFEDAVLYIRENGFEQIFDGRTYTYLYVDGCQYWSMGSPVVETILINRTKMKDLQTSIAGPFGWPKFEGELPQLPAVRGVYLQTFEHQDGFLPYSVGITSRMRSRFSEHRRKFVSGDYNILDVDAANLGVRKVVWKGWGWTPDKRADFEARRSEIVALAQREMLATRIFTMDLGSNKRLLERIEGAMANHFYKDHDTLFDQGMFLAPRRQAEEPISVVFRCGSLLHGIPLQLEI
jgi:hypothetical protein